MQSSILTLTICCLIGSSLGAVEVIQNGTYILEYNVVDDILSVTATVETLGWVGVGLSESVDMRGADLIIGGVDNNGTSYIADYFALSNTRPVEDIIQNIESSSCSENATHTTITFTRLVDTGDELEDMPVERATHIIWAYSDTDNLQYHGNENRGSVALNL